jgi:anti-anti-sigma regulatory factor
LIQFQGFSVSVQNQQGMLILPEQLSDELFDHIHQTVMADFKKRQVKQVRLDMSAIHILDEMEITRLIHLCRAFRLMRLKAVFGGVTPAAAMCLAMSDFEPDEFEFQG